MRPSTIASILLLMTGMPAFAAGTDTLAEALNQVPVSVLADPAAEQAYFLDVGARERLVEEGGSPENHGAGRRMEAAGLLQPVTALYQGGKAAWEERAGVDLAKVRYFIGFGKQPHLTTIWGFDNPATTDALVQTLENRDFAPLAGRAVLGNGEPMSMNPKARDLASPWRGRVGQATFVAAHGETLIHSAVPDAVEAALDNAQATGENPIVKTTLAGLEEAVGSGSVVQGILISPAFGLGGPNPMGALLPGSGDLDEARARLRELMETATSGIPPYFGGFLADVQLDRPAVALALTFADCDTARTAAELIQARWAQSMTSDVPETSRSVVAEGIDGLCAGVVLIESESDAPLANPAFARMLQAHLRRQFTVLQIGQAP